MFVTRLKKQDFVWDIYKKALMIKLIDVMICDIEKKHDLFYLKYRFVETFVNAVQSYKKILAKTTFWNWHLRLKHCRLKMINQLKKIDEIEITQKNASKIVQCDTCAISKMHCLIQWTSSTKTIIFFQMLHFDLIICNKALNDMTCIAHFIDELVFYNWVYYYYISYSLCHRLKFIHARIAIYDIYERTIFWEIKIFLCSFVAKTTRNQFNDEVLWSFYWFCVHSFYSHDWAKSLETFDR
jgi:hypothetical protein